ncbi:MAG: molybdopterin molybdenumtransferase MoeA, partial [Dokdonella sp.]
MPSVEFPRYISVADARACVVDVCTQRSLGGERVALSYGIDRILRNDLSAPYSLPAFANSAMDGFAVRGSDLPQFGERRLRIVGTRLAGSEQDFSIGPGECVRITTGAPLPCGCDSVVIKERVLIDGEEIIVASGEIASANVRPMGEDFHAGDIAIRSGQRLTPARLGVLAAFGCSHVEVARRPRVAGVRLHPLRSRA